MEKRPTTSMGSMVSAPSAKFANELFGGGMVYQGVHWSQDEVKRLRKLYGVAQESNGLMGAGAEINMARVATNDGLRIVAWLSRYTEPGEDPMKSLIRLLIDSGIDMDSEDVHWALEDDDSLA